LRFLLRFAKVPFESKILLPAFAVLFRNHVAWRSEVDTFVVAEQRRRCYRVKVDWPGTVETSRGPMEAITGDISPGGAYLRCEQPLQGAEPVQLTIQPPERKPLRITATVAWSKRLMESTRPHVLGLCFTAIQPEDRRFLKLFTAQQLRARMLGTL
jgi:c-di-GMP-binding flagellar brake protein YcgR